MRAISARDSLLILERVAGIEPAQPAWKAGVLPLNYTRALQQNLLLASQPDRSTIKKWILGSNGGGGWIRTIEAFASDLQSDPFGRSGTPPPRADGLFSRVSKAEAAFYEN